MSTGLPGMAETTGMGGGPACLVAFTRCDLAVALAYFAVLNSSSWFRDSNTIQEFYDLGLCFLQFLRDSREIITLFICVQ